MTTTRRASWTTALLVAALGALPAAGRAQEDGAAPVLTETPAPRAPTPAPPAEESPLEESPLEAAPAAGDPAPPPARDPSVLEESPLEESPLEENPLEEGPAPAGSGSSDLQAMFGFLRDRVDHLFPHLKGKARSRAILQEFLQTHFPIPGTVLEDPPEDDDALWAALVDSPFTLVPASASTHEAAPAHFLEDPRQASRQILVARRKAPASAAATPEAPPPPPAGTPAPDLGPHGPRIPTRFAFLPDPPAAPPPADPESLLRDLFGALLVKVHLERPCFDLHDRWNSLLAVLGAWGAPLPVEVLHAPPMTSDVLARHVLAHAGESEREILLQVARARHPHVERAVRTALEEKLLRVLPPNLGDACDPLRFEAEDQPEVATLVRAIAEGRELPEAYRPVERPVGL